VDGMRRLREAVALDVRVGMCTSCYRLQFVWCGMETPLGNFEHFCSFQTFDRWREVWVVQMREPRPFSGSGWAAPSVGRSTD
jgi:hypothetical protein